MLEYTQKLQADGSLPCRIRDSERFGLRYENCDFGNLVVKVRGKDSQQRLVPLSSAPFPEVLLRQE